MLHPHNFFLGENRVISVYYLITERTANVINHIYMFCDLYKLLITKQDKKLINGNLNISSVIMPLTGLFEI
jgi:hypothetical protein